MDRHVLGKKSEKKKKKKYLSTIGSLYFSLTSRNFKLTAAFYLCMKSDFHLNMSTQLLVKLLCEYFID